MTKPEILEKLNDLCNCKYNIQIAAIMSKLLEEIKKDIEIEKNSHNITCPFCKENNFDLVGLKNHIQYNCEIFDSTISIEEEQSAQNNKIL